MRKLGEVLADLNPRTEDGVVKIQTEREGLLVYVTEPEPEAPIPVALVEDVTDSYVVDKRDGATILWESPARIAGSDWDSALRATVSGITGLVDYAMDCVECGSFLVDRSGTLECAECGLCVSPDCPSCSTRMSLRRRKDGETFWACRTNDCLSALRWGTNRATPETQEANTPPDLDEFDFEDERDEQIAEARGVLEHPLVRDSRAALKLRALIDADPERVIPLTLGEKTPAGKPTVQAVLELRLEEERTKKPRRKVKPGGKRKGLHYYGADEKLEGPSGTSLVTIPEGGGRVVSRGAYPHHELKHDTLNPIQTAVLDVYDRDCNVVVAASTSAGKTLSAELVMGDALDRNAKAIFLSPLRAVSQEKYDEWRDESHPWSALGVSICTGDYTMTSEKKKELRRADVIVMTSEMLDSKTRRMTSEDNSFLMDTLCVAVDESHLLSMKGRGDALECGLMRFTRHNPHARIVLLSATMPNALELGFWLTRLNGKPTRVIQSEWRPTKLTVHVQGYRSSSGFGSYQRNETSKRNEAVKLVQRYAEDKWIVFVHSKAAGHALLAQLRDRHESVEFHSADLDRDSRLRLEDRFRYGDLRVVIATSTLAYGINMPARRVCVLGVHRGLEQVDVIDVKQMFGRAGRVGLDPEGDAYLLLPDDPHRPGEFHDLTREFTGEVGRIESQINDVGTLAFHLTAEVAEGDVRATGDAVLWHSRSLAAQQGRALDESGRTLSASRIMEELARCGILKEDSGSYSATALGQVASLLYYSPFDVADWATNFRWASERDKHRDVDVCAWALGKVRTAYDQTYLPKEHQGDMGDLEWRLAEKGVNKLQLPPACLAFYGALSGITYRGLASYQKQLSFDADRIMQAITLIDARVLRTLGKGYCEALAMRLRFGCSWEEAELCHIPGVGARRAAQLVASGVTSILEVIDKRPTVVEALGAKTAHSVIRGAKEVARRRGIGRWAED